MTLGFVWRRIARHALDAGNRARDARDWPTAALHYRRFLALKPNDFAILVQLGHMLGEMGDAEAAEASYIAAARLRPDDADLLLCRGHLRNRIGDVEGARDFYQRSLAQDGNAHAASALDHLPDPPTPDEPEPAAIAEPAMEPEPEVEPQPEPLLEPDPEPEPAAEPPFAGVIADARDRMIHGHITDDVPNATIEFRVDDRVVGHAWRGVPRWEGGYHYATMLDVDGEVEVVARRLPDGAILANSPFRMTYSSPPPAPPAPAWGVDFRIVKPLAMKQGDEVALFVTHSRTGALKPHVLAHLQALHAEGISVLLIAVVDRPVVVPDAIVEIAAGVMVRANAGYDFAAWAHAIHLYPEVYGAAILYLLNDSVTAPPAGDAFARTIARTRASTADLVGLTESQEYRWHLQSYFLGLKQSLLGTHALQTFIGQIQLTGDKDAAIQNYEMRFAPEMEAHGHRVETLFPSRIARNPTLFAWRALIAEGFPYMKLLPLRGAFPDVDTAGWRETLAEAGFDVPLIEATIAASEETLPALSDIGQHPASPLLGRPVRGPHPQGLPKVAYFGPWNYDNGLGSAARGIIGAIRRTGVPLNLHPIQRPFHIHRPLAPDVDIVEFTGPADIAIVHLNPDSWHLLTDAQRALIRGAAKRIGYWVWEMAHIPPAWWHEFHSVDRIWSPSLYCADLFAAQEMAPVDLIPHAVPLPPPVTVDRAAVLEGLGIAPDARIILYVFDGSSYLVRKNPAALVRAFAASGLAEAGWTLVLKTKHLLDRPEEGAAFRDLAHSVAATVLIDRPLPAGALADLMAVADIYASPHCSEGFGLTIAEAMGAGKAVVATDFGGSADFLDATSGYPVPAHPWRLEEDFGHYTKGGEWARIDEPALAAILRRAAAAIDAGDERIGVAARERIGRQLSLDAVGALIGASFAATMATGGFVPPLRPVAPSPQAGLRIEDPYHGPHIHAVPLTADGSVPADLADLPDEGWIALAPKGTLLHPLLGRLVVEHARARPDVAIFYGDDFAAETHEAIDQLRLKPAFDITLLMAQDYVGAPLIVRADVLAALGGLAAGAGTAAGDDLLLRAHAAGHSIERITEVLAIHDGPRPRPTPADRRAVLAPFVPDHDIVDGPAPGTFILRRRFDPATVPPVTILVPTRRTMLPDGSATYLERLLEGIAEVDWPLDRLTVIVGDDVTGEPDWATPCRWPFTLRRIETPRPEGERFNYAAKMNRLWRLAETEQMLFLNDDVIPKDRGWLKALMTFAVDQGVGGVGARLLYEDGRLQHAGLAPHGNTIAHVWLFRRRTEGSYQEWARVQREWSVVTGAVFATRRTVMEAVNGFDEAFSLEYNDVDLCLRMRALGYRIVCTPDAEMIHREKASRGEMPPPGNDTARFLMRWRPFLARDPSWHPGLRLDRLDMTPWIDGAAWYL